MTFRRVPNANLPVMVKHVLEKQWVGKRQLSGNVVEYVSVAWPQPVTTQCLHHTLQLLALLIVAASVSKDALNAGKNIAERPNRFERRKLANPLGKEHGLLLRNDAIGEDAGTNAGKLVNRLGNVIFEIGLEHPERAVRVRPSAW